MSSDLPKAVWETVAADATIPNPRYRLRRDGREFLIMFDPDKTVEPWLLTIVAIDREPALREFHGFFVSSEAAKRHAETWAGW